MTVRQRKFRAGYNHFHSFTMVPLNLLRDCHFCASVDEDSTEIQFYLVFQLVGISELVLLFLQIPSFPFPLCPPPPDPRLHFPGHSPFGLRVTLVRKLHLSPLTRRKSEPMHKEKRINTVEYKIKFIPLQVSVILHSSRFLYLYSYYELPCDFDLFPDN